LINFPTIKVDSLFSNPWKLFEEVDTFGGLGIGAPQLIQKLCKTQQAMVILKALLTLELKSLNICHLFIKDPKALSMTTLLEFILNMFYFIHIIWIMIIFLQIWSNLVCNITMIQGVHFTPLTMTINSCTKFHDSSIVYRTF
jgi:hypothetical protein